MNTGSAFIRSSCLPDLARCGLGGPGDCSGCAGKGRDDPRSLTVSRDRRRIGLSRPEPDRILPLGALTGRYKASNLPLACPVSAAPPSFPPCPGTSGLPCGRGFLIFRQCSRTLFVSGWPRLVTRRPTAPTVVPPLRWVTTGLADFAACAPVLSQGRLYWRRQTVPVLFGCMSAVGYVEMGLPN
jgi:hypothetical protein